MNAPKSLTKAVLICLIAAFCLVAQDSESVKVSAFAPVKDTETELKYFVSKMGKDLSDQEDFGEDQSRRLGLDGSTVAVLALTLGMHDEDSEHKASAGTLIELATEVVDNAEDFEAASKSYQKLAEALESKPESEAELSWDEPVADIVALMQQVPIVNNRLRRGVSDKRRFERNAKKTATKAVTLAAIAQVSMMNTDYCSDEDDEKAWQEICVEMRDACAEVYQALQDKDQEKAIAGNARVVETCDACHERFRD